MTPKRFISLVLAGSGLLTFPLCGAAADDAENAGKTSEHVAMRDEAFITKAAQDSMTEARLGQLAVQNGKRDDVKKFGEQMATDQTRLSDDVKHLATLKGLVLSDQLDAAHAGVIDRLSTLQQDQFDKAFIDQMIKDHRDDVAGIQSQLRSTKDPDVTAYIKKALPLARNRLKAIERISDATPK